MKKLKFPAILMAVLMTAAAIAGCTASAPPSAAQQSAAAQASAQPAETPVPQEKVSLMFSWWGNDSRHAATNAAVDFWNQNNPNIQIQTSPQGYDGYHDKLLTEFAAGTAPDVFQVSFDLIPDYAAKGQLFELTPYMDTLFTGYDPVLKSMYAVDGKNYGLSAGLNCYCLTYNKTLLDKLGIAAPTDNETYESLLELCKQATKDTDGDGKIDVWGIGDMIYNTEFTMVTAEQYGTSLFSDDGKSSKFDDPALIAVYKMLSGFYEAGVCPKPGEVTVKEGSDAFVSGYQAFGLMMVSAYAGTVGSSEDELDCVAMPTAAGQSEMRCVAGALPIAIYSKSQHPDQALQFLSWFLTSADSATAQGSMVRGVFPSKAQRDAIAAKAAGERIMTQEMRVADFFGTLKTEGVQPSSPEANFDEWGKVYTDTVMEYEYGRLTIEQFCQKVKELGDPILAQ
jgi:ABC-type glycerol-3-phosphate transport system substrate-binding protein